MKLFKGPKFRSYLKKAVTILLPVFSTLFIVTTTAIIIALINGYSLDIKKRTVIKTGVLNVETNPSDAEISISGEFYGKSNRAIPNLRVGTYSVKLTKEGYFPYTKQVEIQHGLASPVIVPMLKSNGQKEIISLKDTVAVDFNSTGYYILSSLPLATTPTATPSPTKVKPKAETMNTYTLTRVYITKPLFDDPHPVLDEKMTITTFSSTPITAVSASPTGKLLFITLTDKSGTKSISLIPFKRNTTVNANLTDSKSLTNYSKTKGTKLIWSKNGDYLIVETSNQIISYNVKAGTRVILAEKAELTLAENTLVWNLTDTGIVVMRKSAGTKTNSYEVSDISYNGNPLTAQLPTLSFDGTPTKIWSYSSVDYPRYVISTKMGTYVVGKLYDIKAGDYEITMASEHVGTSEIEHISNDFTRIKMTPEEISTTPVMIAEKQLISFVESKGTKLSLFIYNKRSADQMTQLGKKELYSGKNTLTTLSPLTSANYITALSNNTLIVSDTTGENFITLQEGIKSFTLGQNDTALLFTNEDQTLFFRVIR